MFPLPVRLQPLATSILILVMLAGCQQYGEVSPKAYEVATALYSICNREDEPRLQIIEESIRAAVAAEELSVLEEQWLMAIVEQARAGKWTYAMQDARTMMAEQVDQK